MLESPEPLPPGKTMRDVRTMPVAEGNWRELQGFVCIACGGPAFLNPHTDGIAGCKTCDFTTAGELNPLRRCFRHVQVGSDAA